MISDEDLETFKKEYKTIEYSPPPNFPVQKAGVYEVKVIDYNDRDVHAVTKDKSHLWLFREYCSLPLKELLNRLNKKNNK